MIITLLLNSSLSVFWTHCKCFGSVMQMSLTGCSYLISSIINVLCCGNASLFWDTTCEWIRELCVCSPLNASMCQSTVSFWLEGFGATCLSVDHLVPDFLPTLTLTAVHFSIYEWYFSSFLLQSTRCLNSLRAPLYVIHLNSWFFFSSNILDPGSCGNGNGPVSVNSHQSYCSFYFYLDFQFVFLYTFSFSF